MIFLNSYHKAKFLHLYKPENCFVYLIVLKKKKKCHEVLSHLKKTIFLCFKPYKDHL